MELLTTWSGPNRAGKPRGSVFAGRRALKAEGRFNAAQKDGIFGNIHPMAKDYGSSLAFGQYYSAPEWSVRNWVLWNYMR